MKTYSGSLFAATLAATFAQSWASEHEWKPQLDQVYAPEKVMEMIFDTWNKYEANLDFDQGFQKTQPVWGIATTPLFNDLMRTNSFDYPHFSWETNVNFVHYAGSWAVPVKYDLSDEDLEELLGSVNGVFFAGGATPLVDMETGETSLFYRNAQRIWKYMKKQKDEKGIDWPIFGICQGFEVIHYLANDDDKKTLSQNTIYLDSRPMSVKVADLHLNSELFAPFPEDLLKQMREEPLLYHAHDWVIAVDTYEKRRQLRDFFKILATDTHDELEFVIAVEGNHYPVTGVMFHPETQNRVIVGFPESPADVSIKGKVNNKVTDQINYYFSEHLLRQGLKSLSTHRFKQPEFGARMEWMNSSIGFTKFGQASSLVSYGFNGLNTKMVTEQDREPQRTISDQVEDLIKTNKIMMFAKTYCPFAQAAKELLFNKGITGFMVLELDQFPEGPEVQEYLKKRTGQKTVPNIFIKQQHIGGNDDLQALEWRKELDALLA